MLYRVTTSPFPKGVWLLQTIDKMQEKEALGQQSSKHSIKEPRK